MTTTTERRAVEVGDRFMCVAPGDESGSLVVESTGSDYARVRWDKSGGTGLVYDSSLLNGKVFQRIDVPAAAPLAAVCKAPEWCDFDDAPDSKDPRIQVYVKAKDGNYGVRRGHRIYCSETCAPPLAAQPAETKRPEVLATVGGKCPLCGTAVPFDHIHVCGGSLRKPAPQPAPACAHGCSDTQANTACPTHGKPAPAEDDFWFTDNEGKKRGPFSTGLEADSAGVDYRNWMSAQTGTPYTGPERLGRPKLAHSYGVEDDCLPEAGR